MKDELLHVLSKRRKELIEKIESLEKYRSEHGMVYSLEEDLLPHAGFTAIEDDVDHLILSIRLDEVTKLMDRAEKASDHFIDMEEFL